MARNRGGHGSLAIRGGPPRGRGRGGLSRGGSSTVRGGSSTAQTRQFETEEDLQARKAYNSWRTLLRREPPTQPAELGRFWTNALGILETSTRDWQQILPKDLVNDQENGLGYVRSTISLNSGLEQLLVVEPFLQVITHQTILICMTVETYVGTIYNFISGVNGSRGIEFFRSVCRSISTLPASTVMVQGAKVFDLVVTALHNLLMREQRCRLNEELAQLFDLLETTATLVSPADPSILVARVKSLRRLISRSVSMLEQPKVEVKASTPIGARNSAVQSTFPLQLQVPGGRHDNDHADIAKIHILPTLGEVLSNGADYLPSTNWLQPHFIQDPVQRHIDTQFRLLRRDTFGSISQLLHDLVTENCSLAWLRKQDVRTNGYGQARIARLSMDQRSELEVAVAFLPPPEMRKQTRAEQREWWDASSRLEDGCLTCLIFARDDSHHILFFTVTARAREDDKNKKPRDSLVPENGLPQIGLKLVERTPEDTSILCQMYSDKAEGTLVEFLGVIPATFVPILKNLQKVVGQGDIPFSRWIVPEATDSQSDVNPEDNSIPPPTYAREQDFRFQLGSITKDSRPLELNPTSATVGNAGFLREVETRTGLDAGQARALVAALTREFSLIQGPPGAGKSHLGVLLTKVLLEASKRANLGPILVICYTNHALDQFLKHLIDVGIEKIIRIGGRSRQPELEGKNLRVVSRDEEKTKLERATVYHAYSELDKSTVSIRKSLRGLHALRKGNPTWNTLQPFLQVEYPKLARQLRRLKEGDEDGFVAVGDDPIVIWLNAASKTKTEDAQVTPAGVHHLIRRAEQDMYSLSSVERRAVAKALCEQSLKYDSEVLSVQLEEAEKHHRNQRNVYRDVNLRVLRQADIIGVTTTGLAREIEMLRLVGSKVVICEEAAEILEAHILSALMPRVEHFVQIGDHLQLRPQIADYNLSLETPKGIPYQLDRSQFERRALGEAGMEPIAVAQLNVQRRSRPEISKLISSTLYHDLRDHESVKGYPDVVGMRQNLFWLDHKKPEDLPANHMRVVSKTNTWEVKMTVNLVRHLVRQGEYSQSDIAVLTPYAGQLRKLRVALRSEFDIFVSDRDEQELAKHGLTDQAQGEKVTGSRDEPLVQVLVKKSLAETLRLATVDNFQGEEAKIIIVSLVRSNAENKVGFLRTANRVNVLLSRAQHGMYLIGNCSTYVGSRVPMWSDVHRLLNEAGHVGTEIGLCCPRHKETHIACSEPEDFPVKSPEGGCTLTCDRRLDACGHRCMAKCHSKSMHDVWFCPQSCSRRRETCDHACPKPCGERCGPCKVRVDGTVFPCGHVKDQLPCHLTQDVVALKCDFMVMKTVPGCGHEVKVPCHVDVEAETFACTAPCRDQLPCGHFCTGTCGRCMTRDANGAVSYVHFLCSKICDRPYSTCHHVCKKRCHGDGDCGLCEAKCEVRCPHSACGLLCSKPCAPCIEPCTWHCEHQGACPMPCAAPCERLPCNKRCPKALSCGHQCPGLCGEECAEDFCKECSAKQDSVVDYIEFRKYAEVDLDKTPIVVLACGHFFTAESLDGHTGMGDVYVMNREGDFTGLRDVSSDLASPVPGCPECRRPIRQFATQRYNRVINRAVMDETTKRYLVKGRTELQRLEAKVISVERLLDNTRDNFSKQKYVNVGKVLTARYNQARVLIQRSQKLRKESSIEHQPAKKLVDAILSSKTQGPGSESIGWGESKFPIDREIYFGAALVEFQVEDAILRDRLAVQTRLEAAAQARITSLFRARLGVDTDAKMRRDALVRDGVKVLGECTELISTSKAESFPRIAVQLTLCHAHVVKVLQGAIMSREELVKKTDKARELLEEALEACERLKFRGADQLKEAVEQTQQLFQPLQDRYEAVSAEEIASIKLAMVSGPGGITTHSGHWYKCSNGHPFAIGECGMPMEMARCPECGAAIGGRHHTAVAGVTRAMEME